MSGDTLINHGFLYANGQYSTIDVPGAVSTIASGINDSGEIVGSFFDGTHTHGFVDQNGMFSQIDISGAADTYVNAVNNNGMIAGSFTSDTAHGFIGTPITSPIDTASIVVHPLGAAS
jgi:uncharacterized membrane protein